MSSLNNFWNVAGLPYGRSSGDLVIELNRRAPAPPPPYELLGAISDQTWQDRMKKVMAHLHRYSWSMAEKVYVGVAFFLSIVAPWPIMFLLNKAIAGDVGEDRSDDSSSIIVEDADGRFGLTESDVHKLANARIASFGVLVGLYFLLWTPYAIFKFLGKRQRAALLEEFTTQDCARGRPQETQLIWGLRNISTFSGRAHLLVRLPAGLKAGGIPNASSFAPGANLPVYVAYPGAWDNVNLSDEKAAAGYAAPAGPPPPVVVVGRQTSQSRRPNPKRQSSLRSLRYNPPQGPPPQPQAGNDDRV